MIKIASCIKLAMKMFATTTGLCVYTYKRVYVIIYP